MHLTTRNVNTAFRELVTRLRDADKFGDWSCCDGIPVKRRPSRNGDVLVIDEPVTVTYTHPTERVLFNSARDANPFFHLYHALWLLAGRRDVAAPAYYVKKFAEYSDNGLSVNGSYGGRWRNAKVMSTWREFEDGTQRGRVIDQLDLLVKHLNEFPDTRRAVLQMWNVEDDLMKVNISRDVCCNLSVLFSLRTEREGYVMGFTGSGSGPIDVRYLDMTVTNRSNDLIWGMLGEDYVTFTVLQEYMAARLGARAGRYHHFTNNLHVYLWNWKPEEWLNDRQLDWYGKGVVREHGPLSETFPLVKDPEVFEAELPKFVGAFNGEEEPWDCMPAWAEPFFQEVAGPMLTAVRRYKQNRTDPAAALTWADRIAADDWRIVATNWIKRRATTDGRQPST